MDFTQDVAIIGGGLAGMAMALALHNLNIPCAVYEARSTHSASKTSSGAVMLSPNALRILDDFGVYPELVRKSFPFEYVYYKDADEKTIDRYPLGDEALYGYKAMRIYRQELLDILYDACYKRKIAVHYTKKFSKVVRENDRNVVIAFDDGTETSASLVIGADGIHSKVRDYVAPGVEKKFMGMTAVTWETPTAQLRVPEGKDYKFPVSVLTKNGVFILAPQKPDGSAMLSGTQFPVEDQTREGWERIMADKQGLIDAIRKGMDMNSCPEVVRSAMDDVNLDSMNMWVFYSIPRLERWTSEKRRVAILGDAAHAIPPTTGNGASQAFEDVITLALVLSSFKQHPSIGWDDVLDFWQKTRQERIDQLVMLTKQLNNKRLPLEKQALLGKGEVWMDETVENPAQMEWLYTPKIEEKVEAWTEEQLKD
ncbi:kynurenine 3-monooxygenase [Astrocystis sublimbata]|nr:kynurenine 3-monooxygenase [Astrocystis sublimbata]